MSYFLNEDPIFIAEPFEIKGEEATHILQSRRIRLGEKIEIQDSEQQRFLCEVTELMRKSLVVVAVEQITPPTEPALELILYQAIIKEKALDFILQKTCELGVKEVRLFESQNAQKKSKKADLEKRIERWQKIALEAAKQSGRVQPSKISIVEAIPQNLPPANTLIFDCHGERKSIKELTLPEGQLNLILGPEGGFTKGELPSHYPSYHIGPRVLRADTAALSVIAILQFHLGDLG